MWRQRSFRTFKQLSPGVAPLDVGSRGTAGLPAFTKRRLPVSKSSPRNFFVGYELVEFMDLVPP